MSEPRIVRPRAAEGDYWEVIDTPFDAKRWCDLPPVPAESIDAAFHYIRARYAPELVDLYGPVVWVSRLRDRKVIEVPQSLADDPPAFAAMLDRW